MRRCSGDTLDIDVVTVKQGHEGSTEQETDAIWVYKLLQLLQRKNWLGVTVVETAFLEVGVHRLPVIYEP